MSSLGHLLCPQSIDPRETTGSIDRVRYSNEPESSQLDSDSRPNPRRCSVPDCHKTAKRGGRCIAHGGGNKCNVEGCQTSVVSRGLCVAHGGGKRCQTPACTKSAQSGGFCWVHGGGKKCGYQGCPKRAQSGGACIAHGGGKRCRIDGCNKVVQYDGLCVGHGGYRRCVSSGCNKRAMANDFCQQHGGSSICRLENCFKRAVRGGICSEHKAQASLEAVTACGLSTPGHEDQGRRTAKPTVANSTHRSGWRHALSSNTSKSSAELRAPTRCMDDFSPRSSSTDRSPPWLRYAVQREDSPVGTGLSALLRADNECLSFTTFTKTFNSSDRCDSHQHPQRHTEHKVYPMLPRLEALQTFRRQATSDWSPCSLAPDTHPTTTRPVQPELRIVVTEDPDRLQQLSTAKYYQEEDSGEFYDESSKLYVQSYYYRKNGGFRTWSR